MENKKIHLVALIWCIIGIVSSIVSIVSLGTSLKSVSQLELPQVNIYLSIALLIGMIVSYILIIRLKKAGFYSYIILAVLASVNNIAFGLGLGVVLFGLGGIAILYGVLQVGSENKTWNNLK